MYYLLQNNLHRNEMTQIEMICLSDSYQPSLLCYTSAFHGWQREGEMKTGLNDLYYLQIKMDLLMALFMQACGVDFEVKAYLAKSADDPDEKVDKKSVLLVILHIQSMLKHW